MLNVEIKNNLGTMLFDSAFPRNDYETKEQKTNADGVPMWSVNILVRQPEARRTEMMTVNVPSAKDPSELFEPFDRIAFENLHVMTGSNDGRTWVSFAADKAGKPGATPAAK